MNFQEIFECFVDHKRDLKVISVASCNLQGKPNCAVKILVDIVLPAQIFFLDYSHTQTFTNLKQNPQISVSFMDDASFTGYRVTGTAEILASGSEFEEAKKSWDKRLISFEADRMLRRIKGHYSTKESENKLPEDFVIVKVKALEAAVIKPDRVLKATH